jgi:hypothetical protein
MTAVQGYFKNNEVITRVVELKLKEDEWETFRFEFTPDFPEYHSLCFTGTSFPIAGTVLSVRYIKIDESIFL